MCVERRAEAAQFSEDENAPEQSPQLIGVGEGNAAADADVFCCVLLEEIADDPDEAAEHEPEEDRLGEGEFLRESGGAATVGDGESEHHTEFADGEESDEGERVHSGEIGFAIGDVHGAPENASGESGEDSAHGMFGRALRGGGDGEESRAGEHEERAAEDGEPAKFAGIAEFVEEKPAPEDAEEAVDVPEREGDAEADVADGEDGERVGDGPEAACEDAPDDEVRSLADVDADLGGAADEGGETPAREENADNHQKRNDERGDAEFY